MTASSSSRSLVASEDCSRPASSWESSLVRRQCGYVLSFGDIKKITFEDVKAWQRACPKVTKVIFGGGWPSWPRKVKKHASGDA